MLQRNILVHSPEDGNFILDFVMDQGELLIQGSVIFIFSQLVEPFAIHFDLFLIR
jgi:hypothetical protein